MSNSYIRKWFKYNARFVAYAGVVLLSGLVLLFAEQKITSSYKDSSEKILEQYNSRISEYRENLGLSKSELNSLAFLMRADTTQFAILREFLEKRQYNRTDLDYSSVEDGIHLLEQSKLVLENQMLEVKTEYEALEVWVAIITVVFLVFSFYSFYKTDEIIRDGKAKVDQLDLMGKRKLSEIVVEANTNIDRMATNNMANMKEIEDGVWRQKMDLNHSFEKNKNELNSLGQELRNEVEDFRKDVEDIKSEFIKKTMNLDAAVKDIQTIMSILENDNAFCKESLKKCMDEFPVADEELKKDLDVLDERLTLLENKKASTNSKIIDDIKKRLKALEDKLMS